ncbi:hypothetical protein R69888_03283 [Paraburkholderia haematera]|uniref:Transposase n=1 Tax=Paraburkholderia haematera TaxID=2793077 RepID=A0ABM8RKM6_9BURK|nr:hypothetical protein R69888_03283 [Paraburkholderia haematera]
MDPELRGFVLYTNMRSYTEQLDTIIGAWPKPCQAKRVPDQGIRAGGRPFCNRCAKDLKIGTLVPAGVP